MHILVVLLHLRSDAHLIAALENSSNVSFESPRAGHRVCLGNGFPMLDPEFSPSVLLINYVNIRRRKVSLHAAGVPVKIAQMKRSLQ